MSVELPIKDVEHVAKNVLVQSLISEGNGGPDVIRSMLPKPTKGEKDWHSAPLAAAVGTVNVNTLPTCGVPVQLVSIETEAAQATVAAHEAIARQHAIRNNMRGL